MDWGRAKTILIIAFIVTNMFLAYNVWETKHHGYRSGQISDISIEEVVEALSERDIYVNVPVPRDLYIKEALTVEYSYIDTAQLTEEFYGGKDVPPVIRDDMARYSDDGIVLEIKNHRELFYNNLRLRNEPADPLAEQEAISIAEGFLKGYGLYKPAMTLGSVTPIEKGHVLSFSQQYKGILLEMSVVEMEVTSAGVHSMHMLWLEPVKAERNRKRIIHAVDALIKVAGQKEILDKTPVEIGSIELVYHFDWETAGEGEALPAWRICADGEAYYVDALSGQIIKKRGL